MFRVRKHQAKDLAEPLSKEYIHLLCELSQRDHLDGCEGKDEQAEWIVKSPWLQNGKGESVVSADEKYVGYTSSLKICILLTMSINNNYS